MSRVIAIEPCNFDLTPAMVFGEVVFLFERTGERTSIWSEDFSSCVLDKLEEINYDPDIDFIVVSGAIVTLSLAIAVIAADYGVIKLLLYHSAEAGYVSRKITCEEEEVDYP